MSMESIQFNLLTKLWGEQGFLMRASWAEDIETHIIFPGSVEILGGEVLSDRVTFDLPFALLSF